MTVFRAKSVQPVQNPCNKNQRIMASIKFYHDKRSKADSGIYPLKIKLSHRNTTTLLNLETSISGKHGEIDPLKTVESDPSKLDAKAAVKK